MIGYNLIIFMISRLFKGLTATRFQFSGYVSHRQKPDNNDSTPFEFTEENYKEVANLLSKYPP